nr:deoxyribodipyrimidine photo-lyase [Bacteroidota bacterium]
MNKKPEVSLFWFRRDLRTDDNAGLYHALKNNKNVLPIFIFDTEILNALDDKADRRVEFIHFALLKLQEQFIKAGSSLHVIHGNSLNVFETLLQQYDTKNVYCNHDYEPTAIQRDQS